MCVLLDLEKVRHPREFEFKCGENGSQHTMAPHVLTHGERSEISLLLKIMGPALNWKEKGRVLAGTIRCWRDVHHPERIHHLQESTAFI